MVYDGVGKATFPASLDCLKPFGTFASFGSASGPIDAFNIGILAQKGSLYAARPTLNTHTATREGLEEIAASLFAGGEERRGQDPGASPRQAERSGRRAPRPRRAANHRRDRAAAVRIGGDADHAELRPTS